MRDQVVADYRDFFGKYWTDVEIELDHFLSCHKSQLRTKMITPKGRQSSVLREDSAWSHPPVCVCKKCLIVTAGIWRDWDCVPCPAGWLRWLYQDWLYSPLYTTLHAWRAHSAQPQAHSPDHITFYININPRLVSYTSRHNYSQLGLINWRQRLMGLGRIRTL